jgi:hypothetical protein
MKARTLLVLTSMLLAFAIAAPGIAAAKRGGTDRPLKGSTSATTTVNIATQTGTSQGTAVVSHLGRSSFTLNFAFTITGGTVNVTGTGTLVAANGDEVFVTFTGTATPPAPVPAVGQRIPGSNVFTITGGTGRFSDASGTFTSTGALEIVSITGTTFTSRDVGTRLQGQISY